MKQKNSSSNLMPYHPILYLFAIIPILIISCTQEKKPKSDFERTDFKQEINLTNGEYLDVDSIELMDPRWLKYHPDSFLIVQELKTKKWITIIDLKSGIVQKIVQSGEGPNELKGPWGISIIGKDIWIFGFQLKKLVKISPDTNRKFHIAKTFKLANKQIMGGTMINDSVFVGLSEIGASSRLSFFNNKGELIKEAGSFPSFKNDQEITANNDIFMSSVTAVPNGTKIVLSCTKTDIIEIYDLHKGYINRLHGPDKHTFQVKKANLGNGITMNQTMPPLRAYSHSSALKKGFFTAYSGKEIDKNPDINNMFPQEIFYFSWSGQPLKRFISDIPIIAFDLNKNKDILFILTHNPYPSIKVYKLSNVADM